jgi:hypothetical protein
LVKLWCVSVFSSGLEELEGVDGGANREEEMMD